MVINLNIGILGHVDSGKTCLAKALSEIASTAAFDKNPQSQSRGITLDLGFSSFKTSVPEHLKLECNEEYIQYTLVDCPGHASLIKTIIGGAQIIDLMLLVVDVTKGIQTQTAECLVICEITCKQMIIVLNKIDLLEADKRKEQIKKMEKRIKQSLSSTIFKDVPMVSVAANPQDNNKLGINDLISQISKVYFLPKRTKDGHFLFAVDHCFGIKGQGTVMTGTVLQGSVEINDIIEVPHISTNKKIKSMQMFRQPVNSAMQGDRLGICVSQFDAKLLERGVVCTPGLVNFIYCAVISVNSIEYFKNPIETKSKFHITIGYETTMATVTIFSSKKENFDMSYEYDYIKILDQEVNCNYYMLLEFDKPVLAVDNCTIIGSKLDADINLHKCRLAFYGKLLQFSKDKEYKTSFLNKLKIYKTKIKTGLIDRFVNNNTVIVKNMFKKDSDLQAFMNLNVTFSTGEVGFIESSFGQSGKIKVVVRDGLKTTTENLLNLKNKKEVDSESSNKYLPVFVELKFKKFIFDTKKLILQ